MSELSGFREEVAQWLTKNCPEGAKGPGQIAMGSSKITLESDVKLWLERCDALPGKNSVGPAE